MSSMIVKKLSFLLLAISSFGNAQNWVFVQKQDLQQKITACDIGSFGKLYVGTERGNLYSFQIDGTPDAHFSSSIFFPITDVDASNSLRLFVYYKDVGQFEYLERFSAQARSYKLEDFGIDGADHASLDENGTIWLLKGITLGHFNVLNFTLISEQILPSTAKLQSYTDMDYDNGIVLSDNLVGFNFWDGSSFTKNENLFTGIISFDVFANSLVALSDQGIVIGNRQTGVWQRMESPQGNFERVLKSGNMFHFIRGSEIITYRLDE